MIPLPPGCTVNFPIFIELNELTDEMVNWYEMIGGTVIEKDHWDYRGKKSTVKFVQYGQSKPCHRRQDGTQGVRLHFHGDDASVASMFILKFHNHVQQTNLNIHMESQ
jgi:hypothetical protein